MMHAACWRDRRFRGARGRRDNDNGTRGRRGGPRKKKREQQGGPEEEEEGMMIMGEIAFLDKYNDNDSGK